MPGSKLLLSVIVPCFNEELVLRECHRRLTQVLETVHQDYEIVFINDGSRDRTSELIRDLHRLDPRVVGVMLSRNFGHQAAVSAGIGVASGQSVVILDADLQDPPELIPEMVRLWREGYQVVYGVRSRREGESGFKLWTAHLFYRLISRLSDVKIPENAGDFRLLDRRVVRVLLAMPERQRLLRAMCSWTGFRQYALEYDRAPRFAGTTKYSLYKMLRLAMDGIISFSAMPLRVVTAVGFITAALAFAGIFYSLIIRLFTQSWVQGWFTLFMGILFLGAIQMISLGILGEYVGRIYTEVKQRPLYVVDEVLSHALGDEVLQEERAASAAMHHSMNLVELSEQLNGEQSRNTYPESFNR